MNSKVDAYIGRADKWQQEFEVLRAIILDCGLTEDFKWGNPCYAFGERNVVLIHGFKNYCALLLFKGALLRDPEKILVQQTKNVQAARQIRFTSVHEIIAMKEVVKAYIQEAIEVETAGLKVNLKKTEEFPLADEFRAKLEKNSALKKAFEALTPGRQRAYLLHFSQPKQSKTRASRVEKCTPQILKGKGLDDR